MIQQKQILSAFIVIAAITSTAAHAYDGEKYAKDAKITLQDARTIALKAYPGKVVEEELEHAKGGSGLRFTFDIQKDKHTPTQEVAVDAKTGAVLENMEDPD